MMNYNKWTLFVTGVMIGYSQIQADVKLPSIIDSQMVIQSGTQAPIWGWADVGEKVTVSFAGQQKTTIAGENGKWMVKLDPLAVSTESRTLTVKGKNKIDLTDVLVGEVWLASGQSNMEYSIGAIAEKEQSIAATQIDNKLLRMFCLAPKVSSALPLEDAAGYWSDCTYFIEQMKAKKIKTYDSHSAVAFFFGLKLQQELKVPVAVIDSSWGGTKIELWIADEGYEKEGLALRKSTTKGEVLALREREKLEKSIVTWREAARESLKKGSYVSPRLKNPALRIDNMVYNGMIAPLAPFAIKGTIWYQGEASKGSTDYFEKLKALSSGWSKVFDVPDMPFYLVQVAPFDYAGVKKKKKTGLSEQIIYDSVFAAQYKAAQEVKGIDLVTISDTVFGNVKNIHPKHKKTVGERLAALALHNDYSQPVISSGPRFAKAKLNGDAVIVTFDRIDQGLETADGKVPNWFELAGTDKKFVAASAKIIGDSVKVSSPEVEAPKYIRLGWNNIAELNLRDKNGWPAFSFNAIVTD